MYRWKVMGLLAVLGVAALVATHVATAQQPAPGGRRGRLTPEQMQQRMMERYKEQLAASDEEWTIIAPRLEKVQSLSRQARAGGGQFGRGRRRGGEAATEVAEEDQSAIEKAANALRQTLEAEGSTAAQIKEKLTAYREAREAVRAELAKAQQQLREVLSVRQEAQLVMSGLLD